MCVGWHSCCQTHGHRRRGRTRPDRAEPRRRDYNGPGPTPPDYRSHPLVPSTCKQPSLEKNRMNNSQTKPSLLWKPNPHRLQLTITTKLTSSPSARLVHPLAAALSTPSRLLAELTADLSSRCLAPSGYLLSESPGVESPPLQCDRTISDFPFRCRLSRFVIIVHSFLFQATYFNFNIFNAFFIFAFLTRRRGVIKTNVTIPFYFNKVRYIFAVEAFAFVNDILK